MWKSPFEGLGFARSRDEDRMYSGGHEAPVGAESLCAAAVAGLAKDVSHALPKSSVNFKERIDPQMAGPTVRDLGAQKGNRVLAAGLL